MIKADFLKNLSGLGVSEAEKVVREAGYNYYVHPEDTMIAMLAYSNTIFLWERDGVVVLASAGDPCEIVD